MGTRNLLVVKQDGEYKIAKYCQWDGYPDGQGLTLLGFLRDRDMAEVARAVGYAQPVTYERVKQAWTECGADPNSDLVNMEVSGKFKSTYPLMHRDFGGGEFMQMLIDHYRMGLKMEVYNDLDFAADSLFCEWAYVIDLDEGVLDVYKGFNKTPLTPKDRFYFLEEKIKRGKEYHPVKLAAGWLLSHLPTDKEFLTALEDV